MQRQKVVLDAKLDNVTGSRSNPSVTLMFASVQVAAFNGDQNMSGNLTFISGDLIDSAYHPLPPQLNSTQPPHLQAHKKSHSTFFFVFLP